MSNTLNNDALTPNPNRLSIKVMKASACAAGVNMLVQLGEVASNTHVVSDEVQIGVHAASFAGIVGGMAVASVRPYLADRSAARGE